MTSLAPAADRLLQRSLRSDPALDFAVAVVRNVTASLDPLHSARGERQLSAAHSVVRLLIGEEGAGRIAEELVDDPPLLAALFQNVDLLFLRGDLRAERVSSAVMRALELASEDR
jgi:hypothetical protein